MIFHIGPVTPQWHSYSTVLFHSVIPQWPWHRESVTHRGLMITVDYIRKNRQKQQENSKPFQIRRFFQELIFATGAIGKFQPKAQSQVWPNRIYQG